MAAQHRLTASILISIGGLARALKHIPFLLPAKLCSASVNITRRTFSKAITSTPIRKREYAEFFHFKRGRFVQNEEGEMAARYTRFDVYELARIAADVVGAKHCIRVEKLADGMHNKALLLTMDDGTQVVGKTPNSNAGRPHSTTASEVATMDFMRNILNIPVPQVHAWCADAKDTPVGAEYIIMAKAAGVPLQSVWYGLNLPDRFAIAKEIAQFQSAWTSASYDGYGSIYFASDLPEEHRLSFQHNGGASISNDKFVLGPTTGRDWIDDERHTIEFDRGPWKTLEGYLGAIGLREKACVNTLSRLPPAQVTLCGPGTYQPTREKKIRALDFYMQSFQHLLPADPEVGKPSAWHSDLHMENIYVNPLEPTKVTCIIDWQSTEVAPLFVQARQPYILDHKGPQATRLDRPRLPDDFPELSPDEQDTANRLLLDQSLCVGYNRWTQSRNPDIWKTFEFQDTPAAELLQLARTLLVDGEPIYSARVLEHLRSENSILEASGLSIPEDLKIEIDADAEGALRGMKAMSEIEEALGSLFPERGCVRPEQYDEAKAALRQCKEQVIARFATTESERAAWEQSWPFDD